MCQFPLKYLFSHTINFCGFWRYLPWLYSTFWICNHKVTFLHNYCLFLPTGLSTKRIGSMSFLALVSVLHICLLFVQRLVVYSFKSFLFSPGCPESMVVFLRALFSKESIWKSTPKQLVCLYLWDDAYYYLIVRGELEEEGLCFFEAVLHCVCLTILKLMVCGPGWPGTYKNPSTSAVIKGTHHHAWLKIMFMGFKRVYNYSYIL